MRKVLIIDTSILCVWLKVRGMETCGSDNDSWNYDRVNDKIESEKAQSATFVLPLATIIETGNHITHAKGDIKPFVDGFVDLMHATAKEETPWAAFTEQSALWSPDGLTKLANAWKETGLRKQSLGDASIVNVANYYAEAGCEVEILTGDKDLRSYQPATPICYIPRRRKR